MMVCKKLGRFLVGLVVSCGVGLSASGVSAQSPRMTNLGEVFLNSNEPGCVRLQFEGFSVWVKFTPSLLTGVSVRVIGSPVTSHYNPDFIVNAYPRLGASPLLESFVVFGPVQNILSEPVVETLTGRDVPATYHEFTEWAGVGSEPDEANGVKADWRYFEAEVIGHPGNIYTALSKSMRGELPIDPSSLQDAVLAIPQQIAGIPGTVSAVSQQVQNGVRSLGGQFSGVNMDPVDVALAQYVGDLGSFFASLPAQVRQGITDAGTNGLSGLQDGITDGIQAGQDIIDGGMNILSATVGNETSTTDVDTQLNEPGDPNDPNSTGVVDQILNLDVSNLPSYISTEVQNHFAGMSTLDVVDMFAPGVAQDIQATIDGLATLNAFAGSIQGIADGAGGVGARLEPWAGLCPSDPQPLVPYYLSGMNVLGWRFKIPEIVYPQTYVPYSNATTIGNYSPLTALSGNHDGEQHNYGSVYPRNGYIMQSDSLKAAAASAFRAAHVVTRAGQPHIYTHARQLHHDDQFVMFDGRNEDLGTSETGRDPEDTHLRPDMEERGSWQLIHSVGGQTDQSCQLFGDPSVNPSMGTAWSPGGLLQAVTGQTPSYPAQWTDNKKAVDDRYVFNLWRRYRCSPDPDSSGSWTQHLFNINLPRIDIIQ